MTNSSSERCLCFDFGIYQTLDAEGREILDGRKKVRHYKKGQSIFCLGDLPGGAFCLHSGKAKIYKPGPKGQEQIVRLAKPGDLLGYRSLLAEENYTATAVALEDSAVCFLEKADFFKLFNTSPRLVKHTVHILCHDLRFAEDHLLDFVQKPAKSRVAETLLLLQASYGKKLKNGQDMIDITLTREEFAGLSGVAMETAVRSLAGFKKQGLISFEGKKVILLNENELADMAHLSLPLSKS